MVCPCSRSRFRWLRNFCSLLCLIVGCCSVPVAQSQTLDKPTQTIDEEVTAFAFAPDGRIIFSTRHMYKTKLYDLQRDDIWLQEIGGKRRRIFTGEKYTRNYPAFSYLVDGFRFSPNGRLILVQLLTTAVVDDTGKTQDEYMNLGMDEGGREIHFGGGKGDTVIRDSLNPIWLQDNATIVFQREALKPRILFSFEYDNVSSGPSGHDFEGRTFLGATPLANSNAALAVERDRALAGPPRLQRLDLLAQDNKELATLEGYETGISVSPKGDRVAYFIDKEVLEVRDLAALDHVARIRIGLGPFQWSADGSRVLLKRAPEKKSGDLAWFEIPPLRQVTPGKEIEVVRPNPVLILHGLTFRDFAISPDGRQLAVIVPGKRNLLLFPLPNS